MTTYQQFTLNTESAKKADGGGRIESTGKYVGMFKHAEFVTAQSGAQGIEFHFVADDESTASFTVWTHNKNGETIFGYDKVNSILTCAKVRTLTPTDRTLEKYDFDAGGKVNKPCVVAPELDNKPIGLLLQRENYQNQNGEARYQMNFYAAFEAQTEFMAAEILEKATKATALEKVFSRLLNVGDAYRKPKSNQGQSPYQQSAGSYASNASAPPKGHPADLDDDLPF